MSEPFLDSTNCLVTTYYCSNSTAIWNFEYRVGKKKIRFSSKKISILIKGEKKLERTEEIS